MSTCTVPDCGKPARARGWCWTHYSRWRTHGDPLTKAKPGRPAASKQYGQPGVRITLEPLS